VLVSPTVSRAEHIPIVVIVPVRDPIVVIVPVSPIADAVVIVVVVTPVALPIVVVVPVALVPDAIIVKVRVIDETRRAGYVFVFIVPFVASSALHQATVIVVIAIIAIIVVIPVVVLYGTRCRRGTSGGRWRGRRRRARGW
jgi:hypothetical protein